MSEPCRRGCTCGCCEGVEVLTPRDTANRPGLDAIVRRAGTHSGFLETMKARLSSLDYPALSLLATREADDFSIALLDAWAMVADVLTFYQERVANEGYLRTATERRSVLELARLVGYQPRPGVAASTHLAFTLDDGPEVVIPAGSRAQSVPGPGELPQPFETAENLIARAAWNNLQVRLTRPQLAEEVIKDGALYFKGIATQLKPNDPLLIKTVAAKDVKPGLYRVMTVEPDAAAGRTRVTFENWIQEPPPPPPRPSPAASVEADAAFREIFERFQERASSEEVKGATVDQALARLESMILSTSGEPERRQDLAENVLSELRKRHGALPPGSTKVKPWLGDLVSELDEVLARETALPAMGPAPEELVNGSNGNNEGNGEPTADIADVLAPLSQRRSVPPRSSAHLERDVTAAFGAGSDVTAQLLLVARPELRDVLYKAWANAPVTPQPVLEVYALRLPVRAFGHNAPPELVPESGNGVFLKSEEWKLRITVDGLPVDPYIVFLDNSYPQILPGSWIVLERPDSSPGESPLVITTAEQVNEQSRAAYGISGKSTRVRLRDPWLNLGTDKFAVIRGTAVYAHSERLELAEKPIATAVCAARLELAGLYDGLKPGRWLIVSGERTDVIAKKGTKSDEPEAEVEVAVPGVPAAELVMVAGVEQGAQAQPTSTSVGQDSTGLAPKESRLRPGDRTHTTLVLASPLSYCYRRSDLKILGNVAPATHGETKTEVLGSGDASKPLQRFLLKQKPLTYVPAPTPTGIESTLRVRVNDVLWHEAESLFGLEPADRVYTTRRNDAEETTVVFGNGERGARPPTGSENVRASYRVGIGKPGNLGAGRISQLVTRPLGVKDVTNPLPATGGGDPESRDQARRNTPLAVMALDRLVSIQDYTDFTRTFAGIGKASAVRLSDGRFQVVHVTIAGEDDIPIGETSQLFQNLEAALRLFGDPHLPVQVAVRDLALLVLAAGVRLLPDYDWEKVSPKIRAALLDAFAFDRRDLAQDALLSQAVRAIHGIPGVDFVDVDVFDSVKGTLDEGELARRGNLELKPRIRSRPAGLEGTGKNRTIRPAGLIYLSPAVPETVILKEIKA